MIREIKLFVKSSDTILAIVSFVYNMFFSRCRIALLRGKIVANGVLLKGTKCLIRGENTKVVFGRFSRITNCDICVSGNDCTLLGADYSVVKDTSFIVEDDNSGIVFGEQFAIESGHLASTEGAQIIIGNNCMFSNDIEIRNGDSHSIIDNSTGQRVNQAKSVVIGNHVWLTAHVRVLKGTIITDNVIIGNSSVVNGIIDVSNCIYAGHPIRIVKENVDWKKERKNHGSN